MRNINRIPRVMGKMQEAWMLVPDWRLGQFVSNVFGGIGGDIFYPEEDEWEALFDKFIKEHSTTKA